jgi:hypothetical protein
MKDSRLILAFVLVLALGDPFLLAQEEHQRLGPGAERIEQFKKIRLMDALKMDEETSIRFFTRYNKHSAAMRDLEKNRDDRIDQLQKLIKTDAGDGDINRAINDITVFDGKITDERSKFMTELREVLTVKQLGEYIVFERNFNQNLREMMREVARDRWEHRKPE